MESKSEMLTSWMLVGDTEESEASKQELITSEISHSAEESDGISVISETEIFKTVTYSHDSENETDKTSDADEKITWNFPNAQYQPLTPPTTPNQLSQPDEKFDTEPCLKQNHSKYYNYVYILTIIIFATGIMSLVINSLRAEIEENEKRISRIEQENQLLRESLDRLQKILQQKSSDFIVSDGCTENTPIEQLNKEPKIKTVWIGSEEEKKTFDVKNSGLPDYCYFTDKDDLFYEYNVEMCERKKLKLEASDTKKSKNNSKKKKSIKTVDPLRVENEMSLDQYISDSLESLNDEIQEIKLKRRTSSTDEALNIRNKAKENVHNDLPKEKRRGKHKKEQLSGEWVDKRKNGRRVARTRNSKTV